MQNKTFVTQEVPYGLFTRYGHRVLCSDGKIRACRMESTPDTYFSIPAVLKIKNKSITGHVTTREHNNETVYCFYHHIKYNDILPIWSVDWSKDFNKLSLKVFFE